MEGHYFTRDVPMGDLPGEAGRPVTTGLPHSGGRTYAKFFTRMVKDEGLSEARGRYVPREVKMVSIIIPGDKLNIVERRVRENDKVKYPQAWAAFEKMHEFVPDGTLLETWPLLSREQVEDLKYNGIHTVEDLAEIPDSNLPQLGMGGRTLRAHAKAFIETSKTGQLPAQMVAENERLKNQLDILTGQLSELTRRFEQQSSKKGMDTSEMDNPVNEARKAINVARQTPKAVPIPEDYKSLSLKALKSLCEEITDTPVITKQNAFDIIEEYMASINGNQG